MDLTQLTSDAVLPSVEASERVAGPPGTGDGYWTGGPSAVLDTDGSIALAYRLRRPVGAGRGYANVLARSQDGVRFETVASLDSELFDCDSLERPALVRRPDGGWRIYLSLATRDTLHWRVVALDADTLEGLAAPEATRPENWHEVWPGDARTAVKDPVVTVDEHGWRAWLCLHPLPDAGEADRMTTAYATSTDGLSWTEPVLALSPRPGRWDGRGARLTAVVPNPAGGELAFYDGRASAAQNWYEVTGLAFGSGDGRFEAVAEHALARSPYGERTLRYVSAVPADEGRIRVYFEAAAEEGGNDLRTQLLSLPAG